MEARGAWRCGRPRRIADCLRIPSCALFCLSAWAQASRPTVLSDEISAALGEVVDFADSFDTPAFYLIVQEVLSAGVDAQGAAAVDDWLALRDRSGDFRGRAVTIEGRIGRNTAWSLPDRSQHGVLTQLELTRPNQPIACTVVLVRPADDLPLGAEIRITGVFVMMRRYLSATGRERFAALLVADGPQAVWATAPPPPRDRRLEQAIVGAVVLLLGAWIVLHRLIFRRGPSPEVGRSRPRRAAPRARESEVE